MNHEVELTAREFGEYEVGRRSAYLDVAGFGELDVQRGDTLTLTRRRGVTSSDRLRFTVTHVEHVGYRVPVAGGTVEASVGAVLHLAPDTSVGADDA